MARFFTIIILLTLFAMPAMAETLTYDKKAVEQEGFGEINAIFQNMTPEQRHAVMLQAKELVKELEKLPQSEQDRIRKEAMEMYNIINFDAVDASVIKKLDPEESKSLEGIRDDFAKMKKRQAEGR